MASNWRPWKSMGQLALYAWGLLHQARTLLMAHNIPEDELMAALAEVQLESADESDMEDCAGERTAQTTTRGVLVAHLLTLLC